MMILLYVHTVKSCKKAKEIFTFFFHSTYFKVSYKGIVYPKKKIVSIFFVVLLNTKIFERIVVSKIGHY